MTKKELIGYVLFQIENIFRDIDNVDIAKNIAEVYELFDCIPVNSLREFIGGPVAERFRDLNDVDRIDYDQVDLNRISGKKLIDMVLIENTLEFSFEDGTVLEITPTDGCEVHVQTD